MIKRLGLAALCAASLCGQVLAQDARSVITSAQAALGNVTSITYSGSARDVAFQQCGANATALICYGVHDPMRPITNYVRVIDTAAPTSRHTGTTMNFGPGGSTTITPGTFFQQVTPQQATDGTSPWGQSLEYYITPWGFLKGAADNNATVSRGKIGAVNYTVLTWVPRVKAPSGASYQIKGYISGANLVDRVETWFGENLMGDMHIVADYKDYRKFGNATVPTKIVQTRGGWPFFEVEVTNATGNPQNLAALAPAPPPPAGGPPGGGPPGGQPPAMTLTKEVLSPWLTRYTTGAGSYDSIVAEFDDYVMVLEAGGNQARAQLYIDEIKRSIPGKPIRYVWNSHPHGDHTPGIPAVVAEGATVIAQANAVEFFTRALNTPRTLLDDTLAKNPHRVRVDSIEDKRVYTDGTHTVEFYHIYPAPHSNALTIAYFPEERIIFQGDFSVNPAQGGGMQPANDHVRALVPALEKLGLTGYSRYINVHASAAPQTKADVEAAMNAAR